MPPAKRPTTKRTTPKKRNVSFELDGDTYKYDADDVSVDVLEWVADGNYLPAVREILGPDQWDRYKETHKAHQFGDLLREALASLGNSRASDDS